jgi:protein-tyrosine phosphatase
MRNLSANACVRSSYDSQALKTTLYSITAAAPNRIAIIARPRGEDWLSEEITALSREGVDVLVSMLTDEESNELGLGQESAECEAAGISFESVATPDRSVPQDKDAFLLRVEHLTELVKEGRYLGVHCRAGIGRSSLFVASLLVRLGWDADAAFDAIEFARGCPVPDTSEQRQWVIVNVPPLR